MKSFGVLGAVAALASTAVASVPPITISGSKFYYSNNGTQFFMRGVAYQQDYTGNGTISAGQTYTDPLADATSCQRDIPYLVQLNTNIIRVYAVDPTQNHDTCMNALADAGIYVIADLSAPVENESIDRNDPEWTVDLYTRYTSVVDALAGYDNTFGFFAGNEVSNMPNNTDAAAFVRAAIRDTKSYIQAKNYRTIGVGYATSDDQYIRQNIGDYMNCGDQSSAIDFLGYNIYSWCGDSSYQASGYADRTAQFQNYSVPVFFAEYGCNAVEPRTFTEVQALYTSPMTEVWSGGIVYMYFEETNNYGLVTISGNSVSTLADFGYYSSQINSISPSGTISASYTPSNSAQSCPSVSGNWSAAATPLPPSPNAQLCECMYNSLSCVGTSNIAADSIGDLFAYVCAQGSVCNGILHNGTTGTYGAYGMCNSTQQLGYALNQYYIKENSASNACSFSGSATLKSATSATGSCSALINQAGTAGTGTVTASAVAGATTKQGGGVVTGSGSGSASSTKNAAGSLVAPAASGAITATVMVVVGVLSGVGMILL